MFPQHEYTVTRLNDLYIEERLQEAKIINLLRQAGFFERFSLSSLGCKGLACLGRLLVTLGRWLERFERVPKSVYTSSRRSHAA